MVIQDSTTQEFRTFSGYSPEYPEAFQFRNFMQAIKAMKTEHQRTGRALLLISRYGMAQEKVLYRIGTEPTQSSSK